MNKIKFDMTNNLKNVTEKRIFKKENIENEQNLIKNRKISKKNEQQLKTNNFCQHSNNQNMH